MRIFRKDQKRKQGHVVGTNSHRSGWPYVMEYLFQLHNGRGVLFDDFIEQTLLYGDHGHLSITEPWVAIAHHPSCEFEKPFVNLYREAQHRLQTPRLSGRLESLQYLTHLLTLSKHAAPYYRSLYNIPVAVLPHPTDLDVPQFNWHEYKQHPTLVHVGWFLKNQMLPWQLCRAAPIKSKLYVKPANSHAPGRLHELRNVWSGMRLEYNDVTELGFLSNHKYDTILRKSIVCAEFFDCSAANTVIESIARCAPILVNRHPAVEEYLGNDYPLFFDNISECPDLLQHSNVENAHMYLRAMDKEFLHIDYFLSRFKKWIKQCEQSC